MKFLDYLIPTLLGQCYFLPLGRGGSVAGNYQVPRSVRLRASASARLTRNFVDGNKKTFTFHIPFKRGLLGADQELFTTYDAAANYHFNVKLEADGTLHVYEYNAGGAGSFVWALRTTQVFRDPSAWEFLTVAVDTTQATASDRVKLYLKDKQITSFSTATYPGLNYDNQVCKANVHYIGTYLGTTWFFDGHLAEFRFIGAQQLTPSSFGEIDQTTDQWVAKKYTGSYAGTNSFYLPFDDVTNLTTLGYDKSGNNNHWTANNISLTAGATYDSMLDVPAGNAWNDGGNGRGNYATMAMPRNLLPTISEGGLAVSWASASYTAANSTLGMTGGKWVWEATATGTGPVLSIGISTSTDQTGFPSSAWTYHYDGTKYSAGANSAYGASYTNGDVIRFELDLVAGTLTCFKNNVSQGVLVSGLSTTATYFAYVTIYNSGGTPGAKFNFGQRPWAHTPTSGYLSIHTGNLPEPAIKLPKLHHNVYLINKVGNTNFTLDWDATVYDTLFAIKQRNGTTEWKWVDGLRGYDKILSSNTTAAETTDANVIGVSGTTITLKSTLPDGTYVIEAWKAGLSASRQTNTDGTITSTVSRNVTSGFSIVTYTGTGANATVGHGLGAVVKLAITKPRGAAVSWGVYHGALDTASPQSYILQFDTNSRFGPSAAYWNSTAPTSSLLSLGTSGNTNSATSMVAYCFAEVPQYSKFGSYTGNGSADGPYQYLGFLDRSHLTKRTDSTSDWWTMDTARDSYNGQVYRSYFNTIASEDTSPVIQDSVSGGVKQRITSGNYNAAAASYVTASWALTPFKYANAR